VKYLLSKSNVGVLARLAHSRALLAFDFDGTLAPIVSDRDAAFMRPATSALFSELCIRYPCAVISGRGRVDVEGRLCGAKVKHIVGNHGAEPWPAIADLEKETALAHRLLASALADVPGVDVEDKRYSLAVHYRAARAKGTARAAIQRAVRALPVAMRQVGGKMVLNLVPAAARHKGDALVELRAAEDAEVALYLGDDVTDEDVFALGQPDHLIGVRVGHSRRSSAQYYLRTQAEVDPFLATLLALRTGGGIG
jgi:trehalose 6-phosphate phosphatase